MLWQADVLVPGTLETQIGLPVVTGFGGARRSAIPAGEMADGR
jgi:hypothetical protein